MGRLSPMRGEGVPQLRIDALLARLKPDGIQEVILALNADTESDATASFLHDALAAQGIKVSRLARGLPTGSGVGYADSATLARALEFRQGF
jgi:recombination protein RecR